MRLFRLLGCVAALSVLAAGATFAQQMPDSTFDVSVARPAFAAKHPRLLFDEAHHNFHTSTGRYRVFADLARNDGFTIVPLHGALGEVSLAGNAVLVIANALGAEAMDSPAAKRSAFTDAECDAVRDWVKAGGALLLIADHAPMGAAAARLASRFRVEMRNAFTLDPGDSVARHARPGIITFTAGHGLGVSHPIMRGRDSTERIARVTTFTGQSLAGPPWSTSFLTLSATAVDAAVDGPGRTIIGDANKPAAGRSQGLSFAFGDGRVVVLGEAAMLSAQLAGPSHVPMGMNAPGNDNKQLALNILHWLTGVIQ